MCSLALVTTSALRAGEAALRCVRRVTRSHHCARPAAMAGEPSERMPCVLPPRTAQALSSRAPDTPVERTRLPLLRAPAGRHCARSLTLLAGLLLASAAHAQSLEERLRTQLRSTAAELSQARGQAEQAEAGRLAAEQARDAAKADADALRATLAAAQGQLAALQGNNRALSAQAQSVASEANAKIAQTKAAYDTLLQTARGKEAERAQSALQVTQLQAQVAQCAARNEEIYRIGREVVDAYEHLDLGSVLAARQPFAAKARVRLENAAQGFADQLHAQRFDARAAAVPAASSAPSPEPSGAGAAQPQASAAAAGNAPPANAPATTPAATPAPPRAADSAPGTTTAAGSDGTTTTRTGATTDAAAQEPTP